MRACYNGNNDAAVILLEAGANAKVQNNVRSKIDFFEPTVIIIYVK